MTKTDGFDPGLFCWAELSTTDRAAGKGFYESLFGWDGEDSDIPGGIYTTFTSTTPTPTRRRPKLPVEQSSCSPST